MLDLTPEFQSPREAQEYAKELLEIIKGDDVWQFFKGYDNVSEALVELSLIEKKLQRLIQDFNTPNGINDPSQKQYIMDELSKVIRWIDRLKSTLL